MFIQSDFFPEKFNFKLLYIDFYLNQNAELNDLKWVKVKILEKISCNLY
jgi:hypothetical protein